MENLLLVLFAALLAWLGARWSKTFPHYEKQRRAIPYRDGVTVALATMAAGIAVWQSDLWLSGAFRALWSVVFVLITIIDIETHFIPNLLILPATGLAILSSFIDPRIAPVVSLLGMLLGLILFYLLYKIGNYFYPGGLGGGDVTLSAFIGAVTGLFAVMYSLVAGMAISGLIMVFLLVSRRITLGTHIPYGPYLCLGGWLGMLPSVLRFWGM